MSNPIFIPEKEIADNLYMPQVIELMEDVFKHPEKGDMVPKIYLEEGLEGNDFRAMPARHGKYSGIKWAALFPQNGARGHGPSVSATIIVNSLENGRPLAVMDGMLITSYRTAAVTAVATKYLSNSNAETAAFIGCGFQTNFQIEAICNVRNIKTIKLFDLDKDKARELCSNINVDNCEVCDTIEDCVRGSDILTTLTPSRSPFVKAAWIEPGMHVNAIGADAEGKQEFEDNVANVCSLFVVDDKVQAFHSGESQHSENKESMLDLFHIVKNGLPLGFDHETGISFFDSTGLAIEDVALAGLIYENYIGV